MKTLFILFSVTIAATSQVVPSGEQDVALKAQETRSDVAPAGSAATMIAFIADPKPNSPNFFHVAAEPNVVVSLILPSGTEVTAANATSLGFEFIALPADALANSSVPSLFSMRGVNTMIQLAPASPAGTYRVKANASALAADTPVIATFISSSSMRAGLATDAGVYRVGQTVLLSAFLFDGATPITGAAATAQVGDVSDSTSSPTPVTLADSGFGDFAPGDGIYTGTYVANTAGTFTAALRISGVSAGGVPFARSASASFRVIAPAASLTGFSEQTVDDNANGRPDRLVVTVQINVQRAGSYRLSSQLAPVSGGTAPFPVASAQANLSAGPQTMAVEFSAKQVLALNLAGPYEIREVLLIFHGEPDLPPADYRQVLGQTAAYALTVWDKGGIFFTGQDTRTPLDTNGNGKYDLLRFEIGLQVLDSYTRCDWQATLFAQDYVIERIYASGTLAPGTNTLRFDFDGKKIFASGRRLRYPFRDIYVGCVKSGGQIEELQRDSILNAGLSWDLFDSTPGNHAPAFVTCGYSFNAVANTATVGALCGADPDPGDSPTLSMVTPPDRGGTVTFNALAFPQFTYTPPPGLTGRVTFQCKATDAGGLSSEVVQVRILVVEKDVTASVSIVSSPATLDPATGHYLRTITVTNTSGATLYGRVQVLIRNLTGGVSVVNSTGARVDTNGNLLYQYLDLGADLLAPGQSVSIVARFLALNSTLAGFTYTPGVAVGLIGR